MKAVTIMAQLKKLQIADLRRLAAVVRARKLHESEGDTELVVDALLELATVMEGKPKKKGAPGGSHFSHDMHFLELTGLYWLALSSRQREAKSLAWARGKVFELTGWKVPRWNDEAKSHAEWLMNGLKAMNDAERDGRKAFMVSLVPADKQAKLAAAIGVRNK
jgi:hypothetical protein